MTAGKNRAAAPMFCMKLDMTPIVPEMMAIKRVSVLPANLMIGRAIWFITPVFSRPAPIIITAIIEMTALLENPLKTSLGSTTSNPTTPLRPSRTITVMAATSTRTSSDTKRNMVSASMPSTHMMSGVSVTASVILVCVQLSCLLFQVADGNYKAIRWRLSDVISASSCLGR